MATHSTRSPPPPALQYGWKNATLAPSFFLLSSFRSLILIYQEAKMKAQGTNANTHSSTIPVNTVSIIITILEQNYFIV